MKILNSFNLKPEQRQVLEKAGHVVIDDNQLDQATAQQIDVVYGWHDQSAQVNFDPCALFRLFLPESIIYRWLTLLTSGLLANGSVISPRGLPQQRRHDVVKSPLCLHIAGPATHAPPKPTLLMHCH